MFQKAERRKAKMRVALIGPSGAGKTYSALAIAAGLKSDEGRIALIDTERSGELYAGIWDYDIAKLDPPFTPDRYRELIVEAAKAKYEVLIIDSLSHAWAGEGGLLDMHSKITAVTHNAFAAWREITPEHNRLVEAIVRAPMHVICTFRAKAQYDIVDDGTGKKRVVKLGMAPLFREGIEYEFTVVFELQIDGHLATSTKDRTGLFDGKVITPSEETGIALKEWLLSAPGEEPDIEEAVSTFVEEFESPLPLNGSTPGHNGKSRSMTVRDLVLKLARERKVPQKLLDEYSQARWGIGLKELPDRNWLQLKRALAAAKTRKQFENLVQEIANADVD